MANYMAEVAKLLGVEMNKDFECEESSCTYRITEYGLTCNGCYGADSLMMILNGDRTIKQKPWKPKIDEFYWIVKPDGEAGYLRWYNSYSDVTLYKIGNCYRYKVEADANRDKWIAFYTSDEILEV